MRPVSLIFLAAALLPIANAAHAQTVPLAEVDGKLAPVVDAYDQRPVALVNGKLKALVAPRIALAPAKEFLPAFVSIQDMSVSDAYLETESQAQLNHTFVLNGVFESEFALDHVFLVLDLRFEGEKRSIFVQQIGPLKPRQPRPLRIEIPISRPFTGHYYIHIYTAGHELLTSQMPWELREEVLNRMVRRRIAGVVNAPPRPFIGPPPEYPKALAKRKLSGQVILSFRIAPNGSVQDAKVKSTTNDALAAAALEAIRQWRFLPRIKDAEPVESFVEMPFVFGPPAT